MSLYGIRVRLRRSRDNAILYDSQIQVANVAEMILDQDGYVGFETYVVEALYVPGNPTSSATTPMNVNRITAVAMGLHK